MSAEPSLLSTDLQLAREAVEQQRWEQARQHFAQVLKLDPKNYEAWLESGDVCQQRGGPEQQMICYRQAISVDPTRWKAHASLAKVWWRVGQRDAAALCYWRALHCPDSGDGAEVHAHAGHSLLEAGEAGQAVLAFTRAAKLRPKNFSFYIELGHALMLVGGQVEARAIFERAGQSTSSVDLTRLAERLLRHNEWAASEAVLRRLMELHPNDWSAPVNLTKLLVELDRLDEAQQLIELAESLSPQAHALTDVFRALICAKTGHVEEAIQRHRAAAEREGVFSYRRSSAAMSSLYSDAMTTTEVAQLHQDLFAPYRELPSTSNFNNSRDPQRRLRIGYLTADLFRQHPVNLFMQPVLARHDASQFEITVYFTGEMVDEQTRLARSRVARWRDARPLSNDNLFEQIVADGIDLLIDLSGHTNFNRMPVLARRAAPVQIGFLAYPFTTGMPNLDYLIADSTVVPESEEALYSEKILRLPHSVFCYAPEENYPLPTQNDDWLTQPTVFGSFSNALKLSPRCIALWSKVLRAVPTSRLLLKSSGFAEKEAGQRFIDLFGEHGIRADRLEFRGPTGLSDMMAEYGDVDIVLDTCPYNGGTTTLQALWMGCPVITLTGSGFYQRMGASGVTAAGHTEWIADSEKKFVQLAVNLTKDRRRLKGIKNKLREDYTARPHANPLTYTHALEQLYRQAWQQWCAPLLS